MQKQMLKNIVTGQGMKNDELEYNVQEFIVRLQEEIDNRLSDVKMSEKEYICANNAYKQGFFEGIKAALIIKNKSLSI